MRHVATRSLLAVLVSLFAVLGALVVATPAGAGGPVISVSPNPATAGEVVTISGGCDRTSREVPFGIYAPNGDTIAEGQVQLGDLGQYSGQLTIPVGSAPGTYTAWIDCDSEEEFTTNFTVVAPPLEEPPVTVTSTSTTTAPTTTSTTAPTTTTVARAATATPAFTG